jgi:peptide/nickel transport system substrate-binding protein
VKLRRTTIAAAVVVTAALALAGCTGQQEPVAGTSVTVAASQPFTSYNPKTSYGNTSGNGSISYATNSQFAFYDNSPKLVKDSSFGSYQIVSRDPFTVKYTIADGVSWSDGTAVDAADLLLAWAANSGNLNTPDFDAQKYVDQDTGRYTSAFPRNVVHFDGFSGNGLQLVTKTPVIGDGGRSLTLSYDRFFVDWELVFGVGLPAHIVAEKSLGIGDPQKAKDALVKAVTAKDPKALAKISRFWNSGFNFTSMPKDRDLVVGDGPYVISDLVANDHVTLEANPHYSGDHRPKFERVTIRFISDPLAAVKALRDGTVDIVSPQATEDVAKALLATKDVTVLSGIDGSYEHLDLQFSHSKNGTFDDPLVREAFLKVVPRQQILDSLVVPLQEDAQLRSSQVFLPGSAGYDTAVKENGSAAYRRVDVDGAKTLLARATGTSRQVCILFDPANPRRVAEFALIQKSASLAGFTVTDCSSPDWRMLLGTAGAYDASLYALRPTSLATTAAGASFRSTSTINNLNFYANPKVDALLTQLDSTFDRQKQLDILTRVDTLVWADAYGVPLFQFPSLTAFGPAVGGVSSSPLAPNVLWNLWEWKPVKAG